MKRHATFLTTCIAVLALSASAALAQDDATAPVAEPAQTEAAPVVEAPAVEAPPVVEAPPAPVAPPAPTSIIPAPPEGKGHVVFFRPSRFVGSALTFTVREGDADLGRVGNGKYFVHVAEPGIHEYEAGRNDTLRLEVEPGETYYVIESVQMGIMAGRAVLSPSDQATFEQFHPEMELWTPRN